MILVLLDSSLLVLKYSQLRIAKKKAKAISSAIAIPSGALVNFASFHIILINITGLAFSICLTPGS